MTVANAAGKGARLVVPVAALLLALVLASVALAADEVRVPPLAARVTDLTGTLSAPQIQTLEQSLREFERSKGSQIVVLMLPSVKPETIEQYAIRLAEAWKIGRAGVDDGIILVIAKNDHQLRIEVGRGLEGAIPDVIAKRVIREVIAPHFLANDFHGGIAAGTNTLMKLIEGEPLAPVNPRGKRQAQGWEDYESLFVVVLVLALVLGRILRAVFGRAVGSSLVSAIAGGAAWLITGALMVAVLAAIAGFIFTLIAGSSAGRFLGGGYGGGWRGGGGWSGGGGFSGGGGGFGGGGASGRW